ncbi:MAG: 1-deoxy-D-xylulose-5-phosphate reductoisomerase, partial [Alphaproteobacteria bacterium]
SAAFQALAGERMAAVDRLILTASGGPFRDWPLERMARATPEEAVAHPNWSMGQRISIDSASMFNKALEVIEARELFGLAPGAIEVVVHPQSIVHAVVGFIDGGMLAHLGPADMRHAIGYALGWPERRPLALERLDLAALGRLDFERPDERRFPALRLAREVMAAGGLAGAVFNAAKEVALDAFIARRIGFLDMAAVVEEVLGRLIADPGVAKGPVTLENALAADALGRRVAAEVVAARSGAAAAAR